MTDSAFAFTTVAFGSFCLIAPGIAKTLIFVKVSNDCHLRAERYFADIVVAD